MSTVDVWMLEEFLSLTQKRDLGTLSSVGDRVVSISGLSTIHLFTQFLLTYDLKFKINPCSD